MSRYNYMMNSETGDAYKMSTHHVCDDERLKTKDEESTLLVYTGFLGGLEHLKIETRLIDEKIVDVMGEYVT